MQDKEREIPQIIPLSYSKHARKVEPKEDPRVLIVPNNDLQS